MLEIKEAEPVAICSRCKKRKTTGRWKTCLWCRKRRRSHKKKLWAYRKKIGLCAECGFPTEGGGRCMKCNDKEAHKAKRRYHRLLEAGLCVSCGKRKITVNSSCLCLACLSKRHEKRLAKKMEKVQ